MAVDVEVPRRLFTVEEYHRMAEAGILDADERVELIEGEVIRMAPVGPRHSGCVINVNRLFVTRLDDRAVVSPQNPVLIRPRSEPQPDLVLLRPRAVSYSRELPASQDVLLAVDTGLGTERPLPNGSTTDLAAGLAASLAAAVLHDGDSLRLLAPGWTEWKAVAERGGEALPGILETLARVQADSPVTLPAALRQVASGKQQRQPQQQGQRLARHATGQHQPERGQQRQRQREPVRFRQPGHGERAVGDAREHGPQRIEAPCRRLPREIAETRMQAVGQHAEQGQRDHHQAPPRHRR